MNNNFQFSDGIYVTLVSMIVVFIVLIIIALCIFIMSKLFGQKKAITTFAEEDKIPKIEDSKSEANELEVVAAIVSVIFTDSYDKISRFNIKKII